jgi:hypothetical protein
VHYGSSYGYEMDTLHVFFAIFVANLIVRLPTFLLQYEESLTPAAGRCCIDSHPPG